MSSKKPDAFEQMFWESLRDGLMNGDSIAVSGLGVFSIYHESGQIEVGCAKPKAGVLDDSDSRYGSILVSPPRDLIVFERENNDSN
ncbi:MAG: hypothetical protein BMS9Abin05_0257 [Rhodothermia bacterium]|nr:MAG: hypothetical protein BMS9Abin05_0257 [Rhodothermia bacterium]